jgi:hypothetical protein
MANITIIVLTCNEKPVVRAERVGLPLKTDLSEFWLPVIFLANLTQSRRCAALIDRGFFLKVRL